MDAHVLFAGVAVSDFARAQAWYERLFGRAADVVAHATEEMWRVSDGGWLYIVRDPERAGHALAGVAVPDLDDAIAELRERGITPGPVTLEGGTARKAVVLDPDGNSVALIEAPGEERVDD
jgi:predicted enzyme related to lactoylglutathione lyase